MPNELGGILGGAGASSAHKAADALSAGYRNASAAQIEELNKALGELRSQYQQTQQQYSPYLQGGLSAFQQQGALSGAYGRDAQQNAYNQFLSSPGQAYLKKQAENAITQNAAATGGLGGGAYAQALQQNAIGLASQDYQNQFNNLGSLANIGFQGTGQLAQLGQNNANNLANIYGQIGNSRYNGILGAAGAYANGQIQGQQALAGGFENLLNLGGQIAGAATGAPGA